VRAGGKEHRQVGSVEGSWRRWLPKLLYEHVKATRTHFGSPQSVSQVLHVDYRGATDENKPLVDSYKPAVLVATDDFGTIGDQQPDEIVAGNSCRRLWTGRRTAHFGTPGDED
jgi:hypothetical protein